MTRTGAAERSIVTFRGHPAPLLLPALGLVLAAVLAGAGLGWAAGHASWVRWVVLALAAALAGWWSVAPFARWWSTTVELTTRRLSLRWGVLARHGRDVPLRRVTDVRLTRSALQRLVGAGTLTLETAGDDAPLRLDGVPQAERLYRTVVRLVSDQDQNGPTGPTGLTAGEDHA